MSLTEGGCVETLTANGHAAHHEFPASAAMMFELVIRYPSPIVEDRSVDVALSSRKVDASRDPFN